LPTIVEPLREQWVNVQAAAVTLAKGDDLPGARKQISEFLETLCNTIILDPACGTANFLYVAMEHMKRLEGEVWDMLRGLGETQSVFEGTGHSVDPHQFLGIEINPRAAAIAELVLWIGYLQWHFRTFGAKMPAEPIIKPFHNIECRDAVLEYDRKEPLLDTGCKPVTRWDGRTVMKHPVTGEDVPDESGRTLVYRYVNPRKATWPKADFVVGNPPATGMLLRLSAEEPADDGTALVTFAQRLGSIHPDLKIGAGVTSSVQLQANSDISFMGVTLVGQGFVEEPGDPLIKDEPGALRRYLVGNELNSSRSHVAWAISTGSHHGVGNDLTYKNSLCFETFPLSCRRWSPWVKHMRWRVAGTFGPNSSCTIPIHSAPGIGLTMVTSAT